MGAAGVEKTRKWEHGQRSQLGYWERWSRAVPPDAVVQDLARRAQQIRLLIEPGFEGNLAEARILELGAAMRPVVHFLPGRTRVCGDPLMHRCRELRRDLFSAGVGHFEAVAEALPFPGRSFDVGIFLNAVDVCMDSAKAIAEWARVLDGGGRLVISANTYSTVSRVIRMAACVTGLCHDSLSYPRIFTARSFRELVETRFEIVRSTVEPSVTRLPYPCRRTTLVARKRA